jgi:UDP-N-acetyl-alpha-D-muramoyl-L-alanyl-L-glutamate epimerase
MNRFVFRDYKIDTTSGRAEFCYGFENGLDFIEKVDFEIDEQIRVDRDVLNRAMRLAFMMVGVSYYKLFPSREVVLGSGIRLDNFQADFLNTVYQEGLGQFAYENNLTRSDLAVFVPDAEANSRGVAYDGRGRLLLQSGGKDSVLSASIFEEKQLAFDSLYISSSSSHPLFVQGIGEDYHQILRTIDKPNLSLAREQGAKNGHIPVTFVVVALSIVQAILLGKNEIITSIGHEGEEPSSYIEDLPVNHQWSKTWQAELLMSRYVTDYISPDIKVGSILRRFSELRITELFAEKSWERYHTDFSSCNRYNYLQGHDNSKLGWCGDCPKCANAYLLFAPFVDRNQLDDLFGGSSLLQKSSLQDVFRGLLGVGDMSKPFECVGETAELRKAYQMALEKDPTNQLSFEVQQSDYDYRQDYEMQSWLKEMIK